VNLPKTRAALAAAEREYAALVALKDDPNAFREKFPATIAAIDVVTSRLHKETKGSRTDAFGEWWKRQENDPDFNQIHAARNLEFKEGEETKENDVVISPQTAATVTWVAGEGGEKVAVVPATARATWRFAKTGDDPLVVLRRYLDRLRDEIIPTAEEKTF
jgi:hypothetical protein